MEFASELQASLREFTLAAACARIELPKSDLWRSHHSSQELLGHRRAPSRRTRPQLATELYEHDPALNILEKIDPRRSGNRDTWLVPHRESETLLNQARPILDAIISLAPRAVSLHPAAQSREVWLRFRGLLFARWDDGRVFFGINDAREELTPASRPSLKHLLHELEVHRHPFASDSRHSLYRVQPERWLESIVRKYVTRIDAMLDQRFVYAQVFANAESEHGMLDLLTVTGGHQTKGQRAHPSATAGSGLLVAFAGSCRAERSLAMVIFKGSLCSRPRGSFSRRARPAIPSGNG